MQAGPSSPSRSHVLRRVVVVLAVLAVVLALVAVAEYRSGILNIRVTNHVDASVTYVVLVDGHGVGSGPLDPNQTAQVSVSLAWWMDACQNHAVVATSNAHMGLAPEPAFVQLCSGTVETVGTSV